MRSSGRFPLAGIAEVDETFMGGQHEGSKDRNKGNKKLVVVAIEKKNRGFSRFYAQELQGLVKGNAPKGISHFFKNFGTFFFFNWRIYKREEKNHCAMITKQETIGLIRWNPTGKHNRGSRVYIPGIGKHVVSPKPLSWHPAATSGKDRHISR